MVAITIEDMQRDLLGYLRQVRQGTSLVILEADHPVAELKPFVGPTEPERKVGDRETQTGADRSASEDAEVDRLEAEIDKLYGEIRDLVARSADEPATRARIEQKRAELRSLQEREAEIMDRRATARLRFEPAEGKRLLARARQLLER